MIYAVCDVLLKPVDSIGLAHATAQLAHVSFYRTDAVVCIDSTRPALILHAPIRHADHLSSTVESLLNLADTWEQMLQAMLPPQH